MNIYIASDHGGYRLKSILIKKLEDRDFNVIDLGCNSEKSVDYPTYADKLCNNVLTDKGSKGILICGTGIGMSIAANKHDKIRAALVSDAFSAQATREHNDTNVLCLGQRVIGDGLAELITNIWLSTEFSNKTKHKNRLDMLERD